MYYDRRVAVDRRGDQRRPPISAAAVYVLAMGEGRPHGLDVVRLQRLEQRRLLVELDLGARGRRHRAEDEEGKGKESTTKHSAIPAKSVGGMIAAAAAIGPPEDRSVDQTRVIERYVFEDVTREGRIVMAEPCTTTGR